VTCSAGQLYAQVNSSTLQLSLTPPIYRFDKSAQATTSLTPGVHMNLPTSQFQMTPRNKLPFLKCLKGNASGCSELWARIATS
ncbi:hypothetical protein, partial [Pseudomonas sp. WS 5071]|uniref:hypothetical protein n=1 Tax=Pseudomonas sp. WS 5071 TaxID=2717479 RepID=UPI001CB73397